MTETAVAEPGFTGFPPKTFTWFAGLEADNSKRYFTAERATYEHAVRGALESMLEELADQLGGHVKMFRQQRDLRFSPDKSPYKTETYGLILDRPDSLAGLYAQLSATGLFAGTGYHALAADQLTRFRAAVADDTTGPELESAIEIAEAAGLERFRATLKSAPRGYEREHPRIGLLRHTSLVAGGRLEPGRDGIGREAALDHARSAWAACAALNAWLDRNVGASELLPAPPGRRPPRTR